MKRILPPLLALCCQGIMAQTNPNTGIRDTQHEVIAITHAYVHVKQGLVIEDATLLVEDEKIRECATSVQVPKGAMIIDATGKHIYASFIELWSNYGLPDEYEKREGAYYWNEAIRTDFEAYTFYSHQPGKAEQLRNYGFGTVLTHRMDGVLRGTGALVTLADLPSPKNMITENAAWFGSLDKGSARNDYPSSLTGIIALLRQFMYDAQWQALMGGKAEKNISLEMFNSVKSLPVFFDTHNSSDILRLEKVAREFGLQFNYMGHGDEYERAVYLKNIAGLISVPVHFPKAYILNDPYDADMVSLEDLYRWDVAPANLHILDSNGVKFSVSGEGMDMSFDFFRNLKKAVNYGLNKEKLLYSLTEAPAKVLKVEHLLGTLEKGKLANFIITQNELGTDGFVLAENWVRGNRYLVDRNAGNPDIRGNYNLTGSLDILNGKKLTLKGSPGNPSAEISITDSLKLTMEVHVAGNWLNGTLKMNDSSGYLRMTAWFDSSKNLTGTLETEDGKKYAFTAGYVSAITEDEKKKETTHPVYSELRFPNKAYGWTWKELKTGENKTYLIKNVTVWTNEKEGILEGYDVITEKGKIKSVGKGLTCSSCETIDGSGMHLTSGIIDEHSHIALTRGVNEGGQSSSAEVRMSDVLNADDINIYRQLSGGVTIAQLLHGSANPIGGQSVLIKLRWGRTEDELVYKDAPPFIKFALGENVKQSNWGERFTYRYPQTRMGVEQFYFEMFNRAKEYAALKKSSKDPVRKDLELEILCEILDGKRSITCHSYVQSEINMLIHVADSMGFKVNTFTHILEGYKVADKMKEHGSNASTFADWWAYKYEVTDAIPYNAAILNNVGINTSVNSDDAEMARRLNHEAAKTLKYGKLTQEEAWKLCTLNPARMLHIDDKVGSVKTGKDADLVLWSGNPLSIYSRVKFTMIDGMIYYSEERDTQLQALNLSDKNRLVQKMMKAVSDGEDAVPLAKKQYLLYDCESLENYDYQILQTGN